VTAVTSGASKGCVLVDQLPYAPPSHCGTFPLMAMDPALDPALDAALSRAEGRAFADAADAFAVLATLGRSIHRAWTVCDDEHAEVVLAEAMRRLLLLVARAQLYFPEHRLEIALGSERGVVVTLRS
jgi:hypothetical protein